MPPPLPLLAMFFLGLLAARRWPATIGPLDVMIPVGISLIAAGLALMYWASGTQRRAGTTAIAWRTSATLVTDGPFRFSRHPAYLGFVLWYIGASFFVDSLWTILLLPLGVLAHHFIILKPEEALLRGQFGAAWDDYAGRVRPWL